MLKSRFVVMCGNPHYGIHVWGPFNDSGAAVEWSKGIENSWVCPLNSDQGIEEMLKKG